MRTTPVALFVREHARQWKAIAVARAAASDAALLSVEPRDRCSSALRARGASFAHELAASLPARRRASCGRRSASWSSAGLVASDGFAGLRGLIADRDSGAAR